MSKGRHRFSGSLVLVLVLARGKGKAAARFSTALSKTSVVSFFNLFLLPQKQSKEGGTVELQ
jgi:hypothetical protein